MEKFEDENKGFSKTMATHLIDTHYDEEEGDNCAAIWTDDYTKFIKERTGAIVEKIHTYLIMD